MFTMLVLVSSAVAAPEPVVPELDQAYATRINKNWRGLGIGFDNGIWGSAYAQGVKVDVPFGPKVGQFFGARLRGVMAHPGLGAPENSDTIGLAGVELFGRGPVLNGILRVYGGGGLWYGGAFTGDEPRLAGGGHYGVEVVAAPRMSFAFELGGQAPVDGKQRDAGASVMAGTTFYLGALGKER